MRQGIYEGLIDDLIYLRKGEGFASAKLRNATNLLAVLGGKNQNFKDLAVRFISAINSLPDEKSAQVLLSAYGLTSEYLSAEHTSLAKRRRAFGQTIGLKPDALAKRENAAISELAIQLITARYTMSPLPFSSAVVPHNAAIHEYVEILTLVKNTLWTEAREYYRLISLVDDVDYLEISSDIPAKITSNCECEVKTEPSSGGLRHRFFYPKPLMRGQLAELRFTMTPDQKLADPNSLRLNETTRAFHEPTLEAKFELIFIGEKPQVIWQYDHLAMYERPGVPAKEQLLDLGDTSVVQANFTDLYGGLFSGVAWKWVL